MENLSQVLYENKRAQSFVQAKRSCIALEQVNGVTVADLRLDFYVKMKKHITSALPAAGGKWCIIFPLMKHFEMDVE